MEKNIKILLLIEVQIILVILVVLLFRTQEIDRKVFNTNLFVYEVLQDKNLVELNTINESDIIIGDQDAPLSVYIYTRVGCSACDAFFTETYEKLKETYIDNGQINLVVRHLVHPSKPLRLYTTKCINYAYQNNFYDIYNNYLMFNGANDTSQVDIGILNNIGATADFEHFLSNKKIDEHLISTATKAREVGISLTPTFFIGTNKIVGNRRFSMLNKLIKNELEIATCND